jgi:hypothetical protein
VLLSGGAILSGTALAELDAVLKPDPGAVRAADALLAVISTTEGRS